MREGISCEEINQITSYDPWFLEQIHNLITIETRVKKEGLPKNREDFLNRTRMGFSDKRLSKLTGMNEKDIREIRNEMNLHPSYKRVDSCAAEFDSVTPYMYSTYES